MTLYLISKCKGFDDINDVLQEMYMEYFRTIQKKGIEYVDDEEAFLIALCKRKLSVEFGDLGVYDDHLDVKVDNDGTSIRAVLDISGAKNMTSDKKYAVLSGVKLKDGTMLTDIVESGNENTNTSGEYELLFTTDRILDVSQVDSLLFWKTTTEDGEDVQYTLNDFYEMPFN